MEITARFPALASSHGATSSIRLISKIRTMKVLNSKSSRHPKENIFPHTFSGQLIPKCYQIWYRLSSCFLLIAFNPESASPFSKLSSPACLCGSLLRSRSTSAFVQLIERIHYLQTKNHLTLLRIQRTLKVRFWTGYDRQASAYTLAAVSLSSELGCEAERSSPNNNCGKSDSAVVTDSHSW